MKQVIQNYSTGALELADVPVPVCPSHGLLVKNAASVISAGTERSMIELARKSLLGKARARPDLMKRFIEKARNEGFQKTFKEALGRMDNPTPLGYSSAGVVIETGIEVQDFSPGDRVACIGAGYASHAEFISVPPSLCCRLPDNVSFEEASFGMLGIIALHGVRCAELSFGATVAVIGLGLLGLLSVQILKAYGCRVLGMDIDAGKAGMAASLGADSCFDNELEIKACVQRITGGHGVDAVLITTATKSDSPVNLAIDMVMFRGRIVLVGMADIHPQRNEMWGREVEIVVSRAGGPGTFDPCYENKGIDYPVGYVRWTENRNLQEVIRLISEGKVNVGSLITHRYPISQAASAYEEFISGSLRNCVGILLEYPGACGTDTPACIKSTERVRLLKAPPVQTREAGSIPIGVIGAGLFGKALLPALREIKGAHLKALSTASGANSFHTARKYGFEKCTTDYCEILSDSTVRAVMILTPHRLHGTMVCEALESRKNVFVEKPLCVNHDELANIRTIYNGLQPAPFLMVGYNRRFSPHADEIMEFFEKRTDPMVIHYRVNSGFLPHDHWVHSEEEGGGRIIGEICHFVDFMQFLVKANPLRVFAERIAGNNKSAVNNDNVAITLRFEDGSLGNILYSASGDRSFSRERIEIFCETGTVVSVDFRETAFHYGGRKKKFKTSGQSMGYKEELQYFTDVVSGKREVKTSANDNFLTTATTLAVHQSLADGVPALVHL